MFTYHFNSKSRRIRNWKQNLIGFQYNDFFIGTFENSFYNRTWTAGMAKLHFEVIHRLFPLLKRIYSLFTKNTSAWNSC